MQPSPRAHRARADSHRPADMSSMRLIFTLFVGCERSHCRGRSQRRLLQRTAGTEAHRAPERNHRHLRAPPAPKSTAGTEARTAGTEALQPVPARCPQMPAPTREPVHAQPRRTSPSPKLHGSAAAPGSSKRGLQSPTHRSLSSGRSSRDSKSRPSSVDKHP